MFIDEYLDTKVVVVPSNYHFQMINNETNIHDNLPYKWWNSFYYMIYKPTFIKSPTDNIEKMFENMSITILDTQTNAPFPYGSVRCGMSVPLQDFEENSIKKA